MYEKTANPEVQKWLDELHDFDSKKFVIVTNARAIVFKLYPKVAERIIYGGVMFTLDKDFGGLFVSKRHVSFEFTDGYLFTDPKKMLEGKGKYRRHLKLRQVADIARKDVNSFIAAHVPNDLIAKCDSRWYRLYI